MNVKFSSKIYSQKYNGKLLFIYFILKFIHLTLGYTFLVPHCFSKSRLFSNTVFGLKQTSSKKIILIYSPKANLYFYEILRKKFFGINNTFLFNIIYPTYLQFYKDKKLWCDTSEHGMFDKHKSLIQLKITDNNDNEKKYIKRFFQIRNFNKLIIIAIRDKNYSDYVLYKKKSFFDLHDFRPSKFKSRSKIIRYLISKNYQIILINEGKEKINSSTLNMKSNNIINFFNDTIIFDQYTIDKLFISIIRNCKLIVSDITSTYACGAAFGKKYFLTNTFPYVEKVRTNNDYIMYKYTRNKSKKYNNFNSLQKYNFEKNVGFVFESDLKKFLVDKNYFVENDENDFLNSIKDILSNNCIDAKKFYNKFLKKYFNNDYLFTGKIPKSHYLKLIKILKK